MHANLLDAFGVQPTKTTEDRYRFLLRVAAEQFSYQGKLRTTIPRAWLIFLEANRSVATRPFDLEAEWMSLTGIQLETFLTIGFGYYAGFLQHSSLVRHFAASGILRGSVTEEACENFLSLASATPELYRKLSRVHQVDDPLYIKNEFNMLWQRPLIAIGNELFAPVPFLVANRMTDGILYDLMDAKAEKDRNPFSEYFGRLFEEYVGRLLKWTFGEENVHQEPKYGKPAKDGPDWIVIDGDTAILFECRSSRLKLKTRVFAQPGDVMDDIKRMFLETLEKYPGKVDDLKSGVARLDLSAVRRFESIILMYDRVFFEPIFRDLAKQEFTRSGKPWSDDFELMDISDLEVLSAWHSSHPMGQLLAERRSRYQTEASDFSEFLYRYATERGLNYSHPLLTDVQDRLLDTLFGAIPEGLGDDDQQATGRLC